MPVVIDVECKLAIVNKCSSGSPNKPQPVTALTYSTLNTQPKRICLLKFLAFQTYFTNYQTNTRHVGTYSNALLTAKTNMVTLIIILTFLTILLKFVLTFLTIVIVVQIFDNFVNIFDKFLTNFGNFVNIFDNFVSILTSRLHSLSHKNSNQIDFTPRYQISKQPFSSDSAEQSSSIAMSRERQGKMCIRNVCLCM